MIQTNGFDTGDIYKDNVIIRTTDDLKIITTNCGHGLFDWILIIRELLN